MPNFVVQERVRTSIYGNADRQTDIKPDKQISSQTNRHQARQTDIKPDKQTSSQTNRHQVRQTDIKPDRDIKPDKQTSSQPKFQLDAVAVR